MAYLSQILLTVFCDEAALFNYFRQRQDYVIPDVYLFVGLSAGFPQKATGGFGWNFQGRLDLAELDFGAGEHNEEIEVALPF